VVPGKAGSEASGAVTTIAAPMCLREALE
jgi:hypothetical protein